MQPISAFHRLGAVNCRVRPPAAARDARYTVAEDARRDDPCLKPTGNPGNVGLKEKAMERKIIRVEPFDTNFEKWGAPVSVCTRAGDMVFVSGMPPFDPDTGEVLQHAPFERQAERILEQMKTVTALKSGGHCSPSDAWRVARARGYQWANLRSIWTKMQLRSCFPFLCGPSNVGGELARGRRSSGLARGG